MIDYFLAVKQRVVYSLIQLARNFSQLARKSLSEKMTGLFTDCLLNA